MRLEHLHGLGHAVGAEARLDRLEHHVADVRAADPGVRSGAPGDDLPIMRVDDERTSNDVPIPSQVNSKPSEQRASEAPPVQARWRAQVGAHDDDLAVMRQVRPLGVVAGQEEAVRRHDAVDALVVHRGQAVCPELPVQHRRDPAIAMGRPGCDESGDERQQRRVLRALWVRRRGLVAPFSRS